MNQLTWEYLQSNDYSTQKKNLPIEYQSDLGLGVVVMVMQQRIINETILFRRKNCTTSNQTENPTIINDLSINRLVNRFVGYGIASLIEKQNEDLKNAEDNGADDEATIIQKERALVRKIRIFHEEAMQIEGYIEDSCCPTLALRNNGYLALVSPVFFEFGYCIMEVISQTTKHSNYRKFGEESYQTAEKEVSVEMTTIVDMFERCCNKDGVNEVAAAVTKKQKLEIVDRIVKKAFHAYYGSQQEIFAQETVRRKGTDCVYGPFRQHLSSICAKKENEWTIDVEIASTSK